MHTLSLEHVATRSTLNLCLAPVSAGRAGAGRVQQQPTHARTHNTSTCQPSHADVRSPYGYHSYYHLDSPSPQPEP